MRRLVCVFLTVLLLKLLVACCPEQKTADYRVVPLPQEITAGKSFCFERRSEGFVSRRK